MAKAFEWEQTDPSIEPVTLTEAKTHLEVVDAEHDELISSLVTAARMYAEKTTTRALIRRTFREHLQEWPSGAIRLSLPDVSVVSSITYTDTAGASQTLSSTLYVLDSTKLPSEVMRAYAASWPAVRSSGVAGPIQVNYTAGYGTTAATVPAGIKHAIRLLVGHWFANREAVTIGSIATTIPIAAEALLNSFKWGEYR